LLTMAKATRHAAKIRKERPMPELTYPATAAERQELTLSRWSRIVKQSHSAFWAHVSDGGDIKP